MKKITYILVIGFIVAAVSAPAAFANGDIPYETVLQVIASDEVFATDPSCGNVKWDRSQIPISCGMFKSGVTKAQTTYHLLVTNDKKLTDKKFHAMANRLGAGAQVRIMSGNDKEYSIYPGLKYHKKYRKNMVREQKIGEMDFIVVPISRLEIVVARPIKPIE